jgi:hypothetical protein
VGFQTCPEVRSVGLKRLEHRRCKPSRSIEIWSTNRHYAKDELSFSCQRDYGTPALTEIDVSSRVDKFFIDREFFRPYDRPPHGTIRFIPGISQCQELDSGIREQRIWRMRYDRIRAHLSIDPIADIDD